MRIALADAITWERSEGESGSESRTGSGSRSGSGSASGSDSGSGEEEEVATERKGGRKCVIESACSCICRRNHAFVWT